MIIRTDFMLSIYDEDLTSIVVTFDYSASQPAVTSLNGVLMPCPECEDEIEIQRINLDDVTQAKLVLDHDAIERLELHIWENQDDWSEE